MAKIGFYIVVAFLSVAYAKPSLELPGLPQPVATQTSSLNELSTTPQNIGTVQKEVGEGTVVYDPITNRTFTVGAISVAAGKVCNDFILSHLSCAICSLDCTSVHNTRGGVCGPSLVNTTSFTCDCSGDNKYVSPGVDSIEQSYKDCERYGFRKNFATTAYFKAIQAILLFREELILCPNNPAPVSSVYNSTIACSTDARTNHGRTGGDCRNATSVVDGTTKRYCLMNSDILTS